MGMTEDEMVGWHHQLNSHEFEQSPADNGGQRSLACHSQTQLSDSIRTRARSPGMGIS